MLKGGGEKQEYSTPNTFMIMSTNKSPTDINEVKNIFATECTPLLTDLVSTYALRSSGVSVDRRIVRDNGSTNIAAVNEPYPDLRKAINSLPSGVEIETISALRGVSDEDKDLSMKKDYRLDPSEVDNDVDYGSQITFHGGISERKFWVIFAGLSNSILSPTPVLTLRCRYFDSKLCM